MGQREVGVREAELTLISRSRHEGCCTMLVETRENFSWAPLKSSSVESKPNFWASAGLRLSPLLEGIPKSRLGKSELTYSKGYS